VLGLPGLARSPFTPSFGTTPPVLAGRDRLGTAHSGGHHPQPLPEGVGAL
jgi:hypothetical protein